MLYLRFYSSAHDRIISGILFSISLILLLISIGSQVAKPFSMKMFFISFFMIFVFGFFAFYFLKFNLCPVLQIFKNEIIISRLRRETIHISQIEKLRIEDGLAEILLNDSFKSIKRLKLLKSDVSKVILQDGKIVVNRLTRKFQNLNDKGMYDY